MVNMHARACVHIYVCVCVCVCVYIYIYIYIYNAFYLILKYCTGVLISP